MTYQKEQQVYFKHITNGDIVFQTNFNAMLHVIILPVSILMVMFTLVLFSEGSPGQTVAIVGGVSILVLFGSLFLPVQERYTINLADNSLAYTQVFFTSRYGFPKEKTEQFKLLKSGVSFGESKFRKKGILIKSNESNLLLVVQYPSYDLGEIQLQVEKYFGLAVEADPKPAVQAAEAGAVEGIDAELPLDVEKEDETDPALYVINYKMLEQIKSWGVTSLLLGALHFGFSGYLSPSWGVILAVVGLLSFSYKASSMFIVYVVSLMWVGLSNIIAAGIGGWSLFGLYQMFLAFRLYQKYKIFHTNEQTLMAAIGKDENYRRSEVWFPRLSILFGGGSFVLYLALIISVLVLATIGFDIDPYLAALDTTADILSGLGMVGLSISLATLISKYEKRWMAWIGLICSLLLIAFHFLLIFM